MFWRRYFFFLIVVYIKLYLLTKSVTTGTIKFYVLNTLHYKFIHLLQNTFRKNICCAQVYAQYFTSTDQLYIAKQMPLWTR